MASLLYRLALYKMLRLIAGIGLTVLAFLPSSVLAQWATTCTREYNSSVNLRNGPSKGNRVIASIPNDTYIRTLDWVYGGDGMRWYRVEYSGLVGWMRSDYMCR
jgi:uncharacterized protein YraI